MTAMNDPHAPAQRLCMVRPHLRDLVHTPLPAGFYSRRLRPHETAAWTGIVRAAERFLDLPDDLFEQQFGDDLEAAFDRCILVCDAQDRPVATATAWYDNAFRGGRWGRLHWLAVRPACQRRGLGRATLARALERLAELHDRCYLITDARRTVAVELYRRYGFRVAADPTASPGPPEDRPCATTPGARSRGRPPRPAANGGRHE